MATDKFLRFPGWTPKGAWIRVKLLQAIERDDTGADLRSFLQSDGWNVLRVGNPLGGVPHTNHNAAETEEFVLVFCRGVTGRPVGERLWREYQNRNMVDSRGRPFLRWSIDAATNIANFQMRDMHVGKPLKMVSHSMGGAVMRSLYDIVVALGAGSRPSDYESTSFGEPKHRGGASDLSNYWFFLNRIFNQDDPVPLIPFDPGFFSSTMFWSGNNGRARLTSFGHYGNGFGFGLDGRLTVSNLPTVSGLNPPAAVGHWLSAVGQDIVTSHGLDAYEFRLRAQIQNQPIAPDRPALPNNPPPPVMNAREVAQAVAPYLGVVLEDASRRNQIPVRIPSDLLCYAHRNRGYWTVTFAGVIIATTVNKKRARGLARIMNDWLRRLQRQEIVATGDLVGVLTEYFGEATNPAGPIAPPMLNALPDIPFQNPV